MKSNNFKTLEARIKADLGPEYTPLGYSRAKTEIEAQRKKTLDFSNRVQSRKNDLVKKGMSESAIMSDSRLSSLLDNFSKNRDALEKMEKALDTGAVFDSMLSGENAGFIACDSSISIADLYDIRHMIPEAALRLVVENYDDNTKSYIVGEGETIGEHEMFDSVHSIDTNFESCKKVASILNTPETAFDDDPVLRDSAVYNVQGKHTKNGENALLLDTILKSKDPVSVSVSTLFTNANNKLSAYAQRGSEIITNESGFAKLDVVNEAGDRYIKKDFQIGEFVFQARYIVRILPDEILPDFENNSSPVLVGDWANVLRLAVILKYPPANATPNMTDMFNGIVRNKAVERVIPVLTTTSDKAYFIGSIA